MDILYRLFCNPHTNDHVIIMPPAFGMYHSWANINDVNIKNIPLTSEFDINLPLVLQAIDIHTKLIFICTPGNPSAKLIPLAHIQTIASHLENGIVIIDEAYIDFTTALSASTLLPNLPNIVILQTLSKAYGLAGIRIGIAFSNIHIIELMEKIKPPYHINTFSLHIAEVAMNDRTLYRYNVDLIIKERDFLLTSLQEFSFLQKVYPSNANFILFKLPYAFEVYHSLAAKGVLVRYQGHEVHCVDCLRVTVGKHEENVIFLSSLQSVVGEMKR
jgi:histidinol-phosphate aminotransferase